MLNEWLFLERTPSTVKGQCTRNQKFLCNEIEPKTSENDRFSSLNIDRQNTARINGAFDTISIPIIDLFPCFVIFPVQALTKFYRQ
jgi:hypothetical protein